MGDPLDDALREVMRLLAIDDDAPTESEPGKRGVRDPTVEPPVPGGHLGEPIRDEYELPRIVRQAIRTTPPHLLTVRRRR